MTRILLVDHHDSYSYNVRELVTAALGVVPDVILHDDPQLSPEFAVRYQAVVLSPGPGSPEVPADVGASPALLQVGLPTLGVCLGLELMVVVAGGQVTRVAARHGHVSRIRHRGTGLFEGLPQGLAAVRYNSLGAVEPLPPDLEADAWAEDGLLMGLHHRTRPWWGVQFHPESVSSEGGIELVRAFGHRAGMERPRQMSVPDGPATSRGVDEGGRSVRLLAAPVVVTDPVAAYNVVCGDAPWSFWLDSALAQPGAGRWSFLGVPNGPDSVRRTAPEGTAELLDDQGRGTGLDPGGVCLGLASELGGTVTGAEGIPLRGGWVGFFGYDAHQLGPEVSSGKGDGRREPEPGGEGPPDAAWMRADRYLAIDHQTDHAWLVTREDADDPRGPDVADRWLVTTAARLAAAPPTTPMQVTPAEESMWLDAVLDGPETYQAKVARAQECLLAGESYEVCLTTEARLPFSGSPFDAYLRLRAVNPAPHGGFLRLGETSILSSSPERFLQVWPNGRVETRPIKGTTPRHADPERDDQLCRSLLEDQKTRAELLMIVDLLRNDLARVCVTGSVETPEPAVVGSYASLHQLYARISGQLLPGAGILEVLAATFPGGSMTGAPKERTMAILSALEQRRRGPYAGVLGYVSYDGAADVSIIIRTGVVSGGELVVGAGGAVTLGSTPQGEYDEMRWKLAAPLSGLLGQTVNEDL